MMDEDIYFHPVNIRLFGVAGVMHDSDDISHLAQEFIGAAFYVLYSEDLHERSKDRIYYILLGGL